MAAEERGVVASAVLGVVVTAAVVAAVVVAVVGQTQVCQLRGFGAA